MRPCHFANEQKPQPMRFVNNKNGAQNLNTLVSPFRLASHCERLSMNENSATDLDKRSIWVRGLLMILMGLAYQVAGTVLFFMAIIQFVVVVANDTPNLRLAAFGRSLGRFQSQIASFVSFASEDAPFPFADWPSDNA